MHKHTVTVMHHYRQKKTVIVSMQHNISMKWPGCPDVGLWFSKLMFYMSSNIQGSGTPPPGTVGSLRRDPG